MVGTSLGLLVSNSATGLRWRGNRQQRLKMGLRRRIRWMVRHGLIRQTVQRQMRAGDLASRLMIDPAIREDPYPYYDQIHAQGLLVRSHLALISAHYDICLAVL